MGPCALIFASGKSAAIFLLTVMLIIRNYRVRANSTGSVIY
jgi:hypothetical protein